MKSHTLVIIILVLVILMVHQPKRTTARVQAGEQGAIDLGGAVLGGFFTPPAHGKKGR